MPYPRGPGTSVGADRRVRAVADVLVGHQLPALSPSHERAYL